MKIYSNNNLPQVSWRRVPAAVLDDAEQRALGNCATLARTAPEYPPTQLLKQTRTELNISKLQYLN